MLVVRMWCELTTADDEDDDDEDGRTDVCGAVQAAVVVPSETLMLLAEVDIVLMSLMAEFLRLAPERLVDWDREEVLAGGSEPLTRALVLPRGRDFGAVVVCSLLLLWERE